MMGNFSSVLYESSDPSDNVVARFSGSSVIVPFFGFGINPLGPRTLAYLASLGISAGLANRISKSILLSSILVAVATEKTSILACLPVENGSLASPRIPISTVLM